MRKTTFKEFLKYNKGYLVACGLAASAVLVANISGIKEGSKRTVEFITRECPEETKSIIDKLEQKGML